MRKKTIFSTVIVVLFVFASCGKKDDPIVKNGKSVYKIEVSNTENMKFYQESIVIQINDDKAADVQIKNHNDFEVVQNVASAKMLQRTGKARQGAVYETSVAVTGITFVYGFIFDAAGGAGEELYPLTCTIKVYKDNKIIDTKTNEINRNTHSTITLNYHNP